MKSTRISRRSLAALALVLVSAFVVAAATLAPRINVSLSGTVLREGNQLPLEQAGKVYPREVITWDVTAANVGNAEARSINVVGDVSEGTAYLPGSAAGEGVVSVKYSVEHPHENQTFSEQPMVSYMEGGVERQRPARPDEYKAVRLTFDRLPAGATLKASYRTRVR
jgi:uncharacterized repeat protein (TIGR01451 family)